MKKIEFYISAIFIFYAAVIMGGCGEKAARERAEIYPVETAKISKETVYIKLYYVGDIKADEQIKVYPKAPGKLLEYIVKEQDTVKKNDVIAYIDRDEVGFEFEKLPVHSPIDGIVGNIYMDKGESVSTNTAIALIVDMDIVNVRIEAVERDLPKLKVGQRVEIEVDAYPDQKFEGSVERVSPVVDPASRTAVIEVSIPNEKFLLKPGMFARTWILVDTLENALIVPRDAILKENSSTYVFVVENDKAYKKEVKLGLSENNKFQVLSDLNEGDLVVTLGNALLKEGVDVKIAREQ